MFRKLCLLAALAALAGCGGGDAVNQAQPTRLREVRVDWLGHESFLFKSSLGAKILTNPYEPSAVGRAFPKGLRPDIVLISNERADANNLDAVDNSPSVFRGAVGIGPNNAVGLRVRGIPTFRNPEQEDVSQMNLIFTWTLDGIRFCFLGNVENVLSASETIQIGPVDVLFVPVGVPPQLSNAARHTIVTQLRPRVIVPMGRTADFSSWAGSFPNVHRLQGSSVTLSHPTLPAEQTVLIFSTP